MKKLILLGLIFTTFIVAAYSDEKIKTSKLFVIPIGSYANETNVTLGGLVYYTHRPITRPYELSPDAHFINGFISFKKQWKVAYRSNFYLQDDSYFVVPEIDYEMWPSSFYGIGNNTDADAEESYTKNRYAISLGVIRKIDKRFASGLSIGRDSYHLSGFEEDKELSKRAIAGSNDFVINSMGMILIYDTRDFALYPTKGHFHQFEVSQSFNILGGDYTFTKYSLDLRRYFSPHSKGVLAFQGYLSHIDNKAPFQKLNNLGGEIRGYDTNRFIDNAFLMMRGEYRIFPWATTIFSRLGGVVFLESGQVASHIGTLSFNETKISYGLGLRIALIPSEKMNLRIDFGFSRNVVDTTVTTYEIF